MQKPVLAALLLFAIGFLIYSPVLGPEYQFITFDDPTYVLENKLVTGGFTAENVRRVFTEPYFSNYHPLTLLSLMLDYRLMGASPWMFHLTNVVLHALNGVLVFVWLRRMTGAFWKSFAVAVLFAIHPTRVESVAWISERKDCLFLFFSLLAAITYVQWVRKGRGYLACTLLYLCSLLSKPMAVTFPFALLLLDFWPLGRWKPEPGSLRRLGALVYEKLPLFALSAAFCCATIWAQGGAIVRSGSSPWPEKLGNTVAGYAAYILKTFWPGDLAVIYPYRPVSLAEIAGAVLLLAGISAVALWQVRKRPYLLAGWLFFLGTMVPASGVVQVGVHFIADRYLYLPGLGLLWMAVWLGAECAVASRASQANRLRPATMLVALLAVTAAGVYASQTIQYLGRWRNTESLFQHTLSVTAENPYAHEVLGNWYLMEGQYRKSANHYIAYLRVSPGAAWAWTNLGVAVARLGDFENAERLTAKAVEANPAWAPAWKNLAVIRGELGQSLAAEQARLRYLELCPRESGKELKIEPVTAQWEYLER